MSVLTSQVLIESLLRPGSIPRLTQIALETLIRTNPNLLLSQTVLEVISIDRNDSNARVSQLVLEVITPRTPPVATGRRYGPKVQSV